MWSVKSSSRVRKAATGGHLRTEQHQTVVKTKLHYGGVGSVLQKLINEGGKDKLLWKNKIRVLYYLPGEEFSNEELLLSQA